MKRPEHIIDPPPHGTRCWERHCYKFAKHVRLTNELVLMPDGTIHEGVVWVCDKHKEPDD